MPVVPTAPAPSPSDSRAGLVESTVDELQRLVLAALMARGGVPSAAPGADEAGRAVAYALGELPATTARCSAVTARLAGAGPYRVEVRVAGCRYFAALDESPEAGTASVSACLVPALPEGALRDGVDPFPGDAAGAPPHRVDEAADATPGTWYLGDCQAPGASPSGLSG